MEMEQNPNLGLPPAWLQLHIRAVTLPRQCTLLIFWLHCSSLQMKSLRMAWEHLRGTLEAYPWSVSMEEPFPGLQDHHRRQSSSLQSGTFWPLLFKTDQLCSAKAECWAEHYVHPLSYKTYWADSPRRKDKAVGKMDYFHSATGQRWHANEVQKVTILENTWRWPSKRAESVFSLCIPCLPEFYMRNLS